MVLHSLSSDWFPISEGRKACRWRACQLTTQMVCLCVHHRLISRIESITEIYDYSKILPAIRKDM